MATNQQGPLDRLSREMVELIAAHLETNADRASFARVSKKMGAIGSWNLYKHVVKYESSKAIHLMALNYDDGDEDAFELMCGIVDKVLSVGGNINAVWTVDEKVDAMAPGPICTPLHVAVALGRARFAEFLISRGASAKAKAVRGVDFTQVEGAVRLESTIKLVDLEYRSPATYEILFRGSWTCLLLAILRQDPALIRLLLRNGANYTLCVSTDDHSNGENLQVFHLLALNDRKGFFGRFARFLDDSYKGGERRAYQPRLMAAINAPGGNLERPLHLAVQHQNNAVLELLLDAGADQSLHNAFRGSALLEACRLVSRTWPPVTNRSTCVDAVKMLIGHGADVNLGSIGPNHELPLVAAMGVAPNSIWASTERAQREVMDALLSAGANVNQPGADGLTPATLAIHRLARASIPQLSRFLTSFLGRQDVDLNITDNQNRSSLLKVLLRLEMAEDGERNRLVNLAKRIIRHGAEIMHWEVDDAFISWIKCPKVQRAFPDFANSATEVDPVLVLAQFKMAIATDSNKMFDVLNSEFIKPTSPVDRQELMKRLISRGCTKIRLESLLS